MDVTTNRVARLAVACACLVWLTVCGAVDARAQPTDADVWTSAVDQYAVGEYADGARSVVAIDPGVLSQLIRRAAAEWQVDGSERAVRRLKAAAAVLMEVAYELAQSGDVVASRPYLEAGSAVLETIEAAPGIQDRTASEDTYGGRTRELAAVWRLCHLQYLVRTRQFSEVDRTARRSDIDVLPVALRVEWHLTLGVARETLARLWIEGDADGVLSVFLGRAGDSRTTWIDLRLEEAAQHYLDALAVDDVHPEVHLRLGRVLLEQGRYDEARGHLERATGPQCQDALCGLAALFLGDLHTVQRAVANATRAYVLASSVLDTRQSALVGMLRLRLHRAPVTAANITHRFHSEPVLRRHESPDAWSRYIAGHLLHATGARTALRNEVRQ